MEKISMCYRSGVYVVVDWAQRKCIRVYGLSKIKYDCEGCSLLTSPIKLKSFWGEDD